MRMCLACEEDRHWDCSMSSWCECECDGPDGIYFEPSPDDVITEPEAEE